MHMLHAYAFTMKSGGPMGLILFHCNIIITTPLLTLALLLAFLPAFFPPLMVRCLSLCYILLIQGLRVVALQLRHDKVLMGTHVAIQSGTILICPHALCF